MQLKVKQRIALSTCFFLSGFCFSSWASRIPTIKTIFNFSEADLGNLLLVMPIASLIGLPISGWMVSKFSSRNPLILAMLFFAASLLVVGYTTNIIALVVAVSVFSFCMRILNIFLKRNSWLIHKDVEGADQTTFQIMTHRPSTVAMEVIAEEAIESHIE